MNQNTLESKKATVAKIENSIKESSSFVVVEYRGLTVSELAELRKSLKAVNASFNVYKNTLVRKANDNVGVKELDEYLSGSNACVFSSDVTGMPKALAKFAKKNDKLVIKAGVVDGKFVDEKEIKELAKLPNREGLLSMFLSCLKAPVRQFAATVKAVADKANA